MFWSCVNDQGAVDKRSVVLRIGFCLAFSLLASCCPSLTFRKCFCPPQSSPQTDNFNADEHKAESAGTDHVPSHLESATFPLDKSVIESVPKKVGKEDSIQSKSNNGEHIPHGDKINRRQQNKKQIKKPVSKARQQGKKQIKKSVSKPAKKPVSK